MARTMRHRSSSLHPLITGTDARHLGRGLLDRLVAVMRTWQQRTIQRIDLSELDDHLISDIGLTRGQVAREASKPFWRP